MPTVIFTSIFTGEEGHGEDGGGGWPEPWARRAVGKGDDGLRKRRTKTDATTARRDCHHRARRPAVQTTIRNG